jgi:hypothetical protein
VHDLLTASRGAGGGGVPPGRGSVDGMEWLKTLLDVVYDAAGILLTYLSV